MGRLKKAMKPSKYWVASERMNFRTGYTFIDFNTYGTSKQEAQDTADRWTSEFQSYHWVVDDAEREAILTKQKTEVLERAMGVK